MNRFYLLTNRNKGFNVFNMKYWMENLVSFLLGFLIAYCTALLLMSDGQAGELVLDGGVGVFNSGKTSLSETKMLTLGVQEGVTGPLQARLVGGGWIDNAGGGKGGSALASGQLGFEVNNNGTVFGIFSGPTVISSPDVLLGGRFQFMDDIHLGIQDKQGNYEGVMYRHLSSAGIYPVNIGRDVIALELRF